MTESNQKWDKINKCCKTEKMREGQTDRHTSGGGKVVKFKLNNVFKAAVAAAAPDDDAKVAASDANAKRVGGT